VKTRHTLALRLVISSALLPALATDCAHGAPGGGREEERINGELVPDAEGPPVAALVTKFYDSAFSPTALATEVDAVLAQYPASSRAHEVAGYLAQLRGDPHASFMHFARAASLLGSPTTDLYLLELQRGNLTVGELEAAERLLAALATKHPDPSVRAQASYQRSGVLASARRLPELDAAIASLGFLAEWSFVGAFDNDQGKGFFTSYPPETGITLDKEMQGKTLPVRWRHAPGLNRYGSVPLTDLVSPFDNALAYLLTYVDAPRTGAAQLRLTATGPLKVWWNDVLVLAEERLGPGGLDNVTLPVQLAAGHNKLLIKVQGMSPVAARMTAPDGASLPGIKATVEPGPYPTQSGAPSASARYLPAALDGFVGNRRDFLSSRYAALRGRPKDVLPPLERYKQATADNALVRYFAALAYWDKDELGKAIDLLNAGAAEHGDALPAFLITRGRYYRQKSAWDKAEADLLRAISQQPQARYARMDLAELYGARGWTIDRCTTLEKVAALWPDSAWAFGLLGDCLDTRGYIERAEQAYRTAHALEPGAGEHAAALARLAQRRRDWKEARTLLAERRLQWPYWTWLHLDECDLARRTGAGATSEACLRSIIEQNPDWSLPYERLADLLYERGAQIQAVDAYRAALARDQKNAALSARVQHFTRRALGLVEKLMPTPEAIDALVASAGSVAVIPGSQILSLLDHEVTEIAADGSSKRTVTQISQALDEQGTQWLTKMQLPSYGTYEVLLAYSVNKAGERQESSSLQNNTVRFRRLDPGAIVVLQYVHYNPPGHFLPNHFAATWFFQAPRTQQEQSTWILVHAKDRRLRVAVHGNAKDESRDEGVLVVRTLSAEHVPPLVDEPMMPPAEDLLWHASVTTVDSWDEYARWERALLSEAYRSSPEIESLASRLVQGATTARDRLDKLFEFVARQIRYQQEYETTIAGVRPHEPPVVLERGYGDCKDKAVLLIRLAKSVGLLGELALLRTTDAGEIERDLPNQQFNHAIVYIPAQEGLAKGFFLDPTTDALDIGNLRDDDQGATALVLEPEGEGYRFVDIPYDDPALEYTRHHIVVTIASPEKATAQDEIVMRGNDASYIRRVARNSESASRMLQDLASALFAGSTVTASHAPNPDDVWHPAEVSITSDVSNSLKAQDGAWRMAVPALLRLANAATLGTRQTPVRLGPPRTASFDIDVSLPERFRFSHTPPPFVVEHACFVARRETKTEGRTARIRFSVVSRCANVSLADYPAFREAVQKVIAAAQEQIIFVRDEGRRGK